jgi:hypothetical protein
METKLRNLGQQLAQERAIERTLEDDGQHTLSTAYLYISVGSTSRMIVGC